MEALYKGMEKSIVVVGGAGGIGRCIVEQLRQEYKIYVLDIKDITTSIEQCDTIIPIVGDILEESTLDLVEEILSKEESFMGIIFSAGIMVPGTVMDTEDDIWQKVLDTNLTSVYKLSKRLLPYLMQHKKSYIIAIASNMAIVGSYGLTAYSVSKAALVELVKCMSLDFGTKGVMVNSISPGFIDTDMLASAKKVFNINRNWMYTTGGLPKQTVDKEDVAKAVEFLLTTHSMNGANIVPDAGYVVR